MIKFVEDLFRVMRFLFSILVLFFHVISGLVLFGLGVYLLFREQPISIDYGKINFLASMFLLFLTTWALRKACWGWVGEMLREWASQEARDDARRVKRRPPITSTSRSGA
jgi:hypothetical protein